MSRTYEISYRGAMFRDRVTADKSLEELAIDLQNGWLIVEDRVVNASIIEQIVEVKEE